MTRSRRRPTEMSFIFQDCEIVNNAGLWRPFQRAAFMPRRVAVWATYWLDARRHGRNADGWRRSSLLIHAMNGILVFAIAQDLLPFSAAVMTAGLFLSHPLTTMASCYVAGRSASLSTMVQLLAAIAALHGFFLVALILVGAATWWVKEDSAAGIFLIGIVWLLG